MARLLATAGAGVSLCRAWSRARSGAEVASETAGRNTSEKNKEVWVELEAGVQVCFIPHESGTPAHDYRAGDYWLIPARTATGDVEWPGPVGQPASQPPQGIPAIMRLWLLLRLTRIKKPRLVMI